MNQNQKPSNPPIQERDDRPIHHPYIPRSMRRKIWMTRFKSLAWRKRNRGGNNSGSPALAFSAFPDSEPAGEENDLQTTDFRMHPAADKRDPMSRTVGSDWFSRTS